MRILNKGAGVAFYATDDSAGFDIPSNENTTLEPGEYKLIKTGLFLDPESMPKDSDDTIRNALFILPRSGLAFKHGVTVLNAPGLIDEKYPNEIGVLLINHGKEAFEVKVGDRIAQGFATDAYVLYGDIVHKSDKRTGGFGSSGVKP